MNQQTIIGDRFRLEELIGYGGMGEVHKATDLHSGKFVAVKRLKPETVANDPAFVERFMREGEALRKLNHPNIVGMVAAVSSEDEHYLVLDYVSGGSLADLLQATPQLPVEQVLRFAIDLADALASAHQLNIIHRDLKPANVLLAEDGTPRLTDFGTARMDQTSPLTQTGMIIGTYAYMSPEMCNGDPVDGRTDIWSFGVMLFEMLAGRQPFDHPQLMHLLMDIMTEPPPDLQQLRPDVSDSLADLVYRMLAKNRDQRIPDIRLVGAELEEIFEGRSLLDRSTTVTSRSHASARFAGLVREGKERPRYNLPLIATPFVGRENELAEISRLLSDSACRLLTVHGPGGIGKTRLALQAAVNHLDQFEHGVYFVDLSVVEHASLIIPTMADAIQFSFFGSDDPEKQLLNYLQNKEIFLILDNFEQLIDQAELLPRILRDAARVQLLVTSRERLHLREEWVLPLQGLPVPEKLEKETVAGASAIQLFLQSARRVRTNFSATNKDLEAIHQICQLVEGLPLGIELAAAWMNILTPAEIARQISDDFDFLVTNLRDIPLRHRSVRSVFEYSWRLLDDKEKEALRRLSVFRGGFERAAAHQVTGANLLSLNVLMDKSLLRRAPASGRYDMQELLRQFAAEKLVEVSKEEEETRQRHAHYYLPYLQKRAADLIGGRQSQALSEIESELGNIRVAWQWAVDQRAQEAIALGLDALYHFYQLRGRQREGAEAFAQAARALRTMAANEPDLVLARVIARQGAYSRFIGRLDQSKALLQESLDMARALDDKREIAFSLYHLGAADPANPNARQHWQESLTLAQEIDNQTLVAESLNWLAFSSFQQGEYDEAVRLLEKSLEVRRVIEDERGLAIGLTNLGTLQAQVGDYKNAQTLMQESLLIYQRLNDLHGISHIYNNLCYIAIRNQDYEVAQRWGEQAVAYYREVGDKRGEGLALGNLSEIAFYQGDYARARSICNRCIALYREIGLSTSSYHNDLGRIALAQGNYEEAKKEFTQVLQEELHPSLALSVLTGVAAILAHQGEPDVALPLLTFIRENPASEQVVKERASALINEVTEHMPQEQLSESQAQSDRQTLTEWLELVRQKL